MKKMVFILFMVLIIPFLVVTVSAANGSGIMPSGILLSELEQFVDDFSEEYIGNTTVGASIIVLIVRAFQYAPYTTLQIHFGLNIGYMVFTLIVVAFMMIKCRGSKLSKWNKLFYICSGNVAVVFSALMIAWELYRQNQYKQNETAIALVQKLNFHEENNKQKYKIENSQTIMNEPK